jgi:hypothetical protein
MTETEVQALLVRAITELMAALSDAHETIAVLREEAAFALRPELRRN